MDGRAQTGVVGCVHVDDYEHDVIRKHEKTRQDKEDDRTRHVLTLDANAEPVFLTYRGGPEIDRLVDGRSLRDGAALRLHRARRRPAHGLAGRRIAGRWPGRVRRGAARLRRRRAPPLRQRLAGGQGAPGAPTQRTGATRSTTGSWRCSFRPTSSGSCPITAWCATSAGQTPADVLARLARRRPAVTADRRPASAAAGQLRLLSRRRAGTGSSSIPAAIDRSDPIGSLDVSLLQDRVLGPILGIGDPRTDKRIDFVGGIRGTAELERRVRSGEMAIAFSLYPDHAGAAHGRLRCRARSCRPRAPGSSPSCGAGSSCMS